MLKKFLLWIIKRYNLFHLLSQAQTQDNIDNCNSSVTNLGATFYPDTIVSNTQNDPTKITVGKGSHIRGQLNLFRFGGEIVIGENCYVGDHSRIWSGEKVIIGNHVLISHNVNIIDTNAHEIEPIERSERFSELINNGPWATKGNIKTSPIIIEDYAWISFNASILKGVRVGKGAIVATGSVVTKDVPDYTMVAGNPARIVKQIVTAES